MPTLVRYRCDSVDAWGVVRGDYVHAVRGSVYDSWTEGDRVGRLDEVELGVPCEPRHVVALAYNYKDLVGPRDVYDEPLVFLKAVTGLIPGGAPIEIPPGCERVWVEVEAAFVVKREAKRVSAASAADFILGYTVANDVTAENICGRDHHLARSKSIDSFCPVSTHLVTDFDLRSKRLTTRVNGRLTQDGTTDNRIIDDGEVLSVVSRFLTLMPGDLVLTGTPAGAMDSIVRAGDQVELEIEGLGVLRSPVVAASDGR